MSMTAVIGALRAVLGLETAAFEKGIGESVKGLNQLSKQFAATAKTMESVGKGMSVAITAPVIAWRALSIKAGSDFEDAMIRVRKATGATSDQVSQLADMAKRIGEDSGLGATKTAGLIEDLGKRGVDITDILGGAAEAAIKLAKANNGELGPSAELIERLMKTFGVTAGDLPKLVDGITATIRTSRLTLDDYKDAVDGGAAALAGMGLKFEDFNAGLAVTSSAFASGGEAVASFRSFITKLVPSGKEAADAMKALKLEFFDSKGAMIPLEEIAGRLNVALAGLSDKSKIDVINKIFGRRAMNTAITLAKQGAEGVRNMKDQIEAMDRQAGGGVKGPESLSLSLKKLKASLEGLQIAIAETGLVAWAAQMAQTMTGFVRVLNQTNPEMLKWAVTIASVAAAIGPITLTFGKFFAVLGKIGPMIARLAPAFAGVAAAALPWVAVAAAIGATAAALVFFSDKIPIGLNGTVLLSDALSAIGDEFRNFGAMAGVAGDAIAGWAGKVADLLGLTETFQGVTAAWQTMLDTIGGGSGASSGLGDVLYLVFIQPLDTALNFITGFTAAVIVAFKTLGPAIGDLMTRFGNTLLSALQTVINGAIEKLNWLRAQIGKSELPMIQFEPWANENAGAADKAGRAIAQAFAEGFSGSLIKETIARVTGNATKKATERLLAKVAQDAMIANNDPKGIGSGGKPIGGGGGGGGDNLDLGGGGHEKKTAAQKLEEYIVALGRQVELEKMAAKEKAVNEALDKAQAIATEGKIKLTEKDTSTIREYVLAELAAKDATAERARLEQLAKKTIEDSATAQETYNKALADLKKMLDLNLISQDQFTKAKKVLDDQLAKSNDGLQSQLEQVSTAITDAAKEAAQELLNTDKTFGEILTSMAKRFSQFALQIFLFEPLFKQLGDTLKGLASSAVGGAGSGGGGGLLSGLGNWFSGLFGKSGAGGGGIDAEIANWSSYGGARAGGGNVNPGSWYRINEKGQEGFAPSIPGRIIPADDMASMSGAGGARVVNQTMIFKTPDADSFRRSKRQVARQARTLTGAA
jgi:TP901 family phage tail tape measure protein